MIPYSTFVNVKRWTKLRLFQRISCFSAQSQFPVVHIIGTICVLGTCSSRASFLSWWFVNQKSFDAEDHASIGITFPPVSPKFKSFVDPICNRRKRGGGGRGSPSNKISSYRRESGSAKWFQLLWHQHQSWYWSWWFSLWLSWRLPETDVFMMGNLRDGCHTASEGRFTVILGW